nr:alpha/beta hydrolase [Ardenticatena sp.]
MTTLLLDDTPVFYQKRGSGEPTVLFIHGAGGTWKHWAYCLKQMPVGQRIAFDLPGHGRSGGTGRYSIEGYAYFMLSLLDALSIDKAVLVGHSMGGAIAIQTTLLAPERVRGLGLVATGARLKVNPTVLDGLQHDTLGTIRRMVRWMYARELSPQEMAAAVQEMAATPKSVLYGDFAACDAFDSRAALFDIQCPTIVIGAEHDKMTPPRLSEELALAIRRAELVMIPDAGHMVMLEQPHAVCDALTTFVKRIRQNSRSN